MTLKSQRVRQILTGAGVRREDSDDELGVDDHSWEWIFATSGNKVTRHIVGARFGSFQCMVGDCVLLKAQGYKEAWVAIICEFCSDNADDGEKCAKFMWFSSDKEVRSQDKKRTDALKNELYITPAFDVNPLASINGSATIMSLSGFRSLYPSGRIPIKSKDYGKVFICRRGCNVRTATYTEEFFWEDTYRGIEDLHTLISKIREETKSTRNRKPRSSHFGNSSSDLSRHNQPDQRDELVEIPQKKRKVDVGYLSRQGNDTGRAVRKSNTTPTHRRVVTKKQLEFTPLGVRRLSPGHISSSLQVARMHLHVSSVPRSLPCREEVFGQVYSQLEAAIIDGSGSCIYISGTPGTGKTATVREVVSQLHAAVQADELDDFIFVEINGMKVTNPHHAYSLLWEALEGDRVSSSHAFDLLEKEFSSPSPRRVPCVVLMDELDQLVTKNQSVMYNFFNWPGLRHSRLIVLAVANTMDLPERTLSNKISSRLGLTRITFPGYTHDELAKIIQSRLEGVSDDLVEPDAIQFASRKVAAVSGDARRVLDICRRAVEIAESQAGQEGNLPRTPSKSEDPSDMERAQWKAHGRVTIRTIKQAINEATSSPVQECLKSLPLAAKILVAALSARLRRVGVAEALFADIIEDSTRLARVSTSTSVRDCLSTKVSRSGGQISYETDKIVPTPRGLAFGSAAAELAEAGIINLESKRGEKTGKIRLNVSEDEVILAFKDDLEAQNLRFS